MWRRKTALDFIPLAKEVYYLAAADAKFLETGKSKEISSNSSAAMIGLSIRNSLKGMTLPVPEKFSRSLTFSRQNEAENSKEESFFSDVHENRISIRISCVGPIVEWIQRGPPKTEVQVRFLLGPPLIFLTDIFKPLYNLKFFSLFIWNNLSLFRIELKTKPDLRSFLILLFEFSSATEL